MKLEEFFEALDIEVTEQQHLHGEVRIGKFILIYDIDVVMEIIPAAFISIGSVAVDSVTDEMITLMDWTINQAVLTHTENESELDVSDELASYLNTWYFNQ